jgi:long-chain acyl-CoA synthetase
VQLNKLLRQFAARTTDECLIAQGVSYCFGDLESMCGQWSREFAQREILPGEVVGVKAENSGEAISLLLALLAHRCIVALIPYAAVDDGSYLADGQLGSLFHIQADGSWSWRACFREATHPLLRRLRAEGMPGFIIFSSGSSGRPKAVLHSLERFLIKFDSPGKSLRTLAFLLFDHIAGIDTLFYTLSSGGVLVLPDRGRRDPRSICRLIQAHQVEVLPVSPTFLQLLCLSRDYVDFDLSSLRIITYGAEPMNQLTLDRVADLFPQVKLLQKYGTSEFGSPRSLSRGNDSLWLKLKTDELAAKVVDDVLWLKTDTAMLGYLNAPSPFDQDGWLCTGDLVEREGEWIRILGRKSDLIIVSGEKVYPQEVENTILELDFVQDVMVKGESQALTGQIVTAHVNLRQPRDEKIVRTEVRRHCRTRLEPYKIPVKVKIVSAPLACDRHKKTRT